MEKLLSKRYQNNGESNLKLNPVQIKQRDYINKCVNGGKYLFEEVSCLICKGETFQKLSEKDRYGLYHPVVICLTCGLIQNNPRMTQHSFDQFYNSGHRRLYVGTEEVTEEYLTGRYNAGKPIAEYISKYVTIHNSKILEVGCGSGAILKYLQDKGATVKGIDLSEEYLEHGRKKYQIDLECTDLLNFQSNEKYDIIIYSDVLEHILNINEHLAKIRLLLAEEGVLYIKVPGVKRTHVNYNFDFLNSLQNAHVYYFSLTTLRNLLQLSGFALLSGNEDVQSIWQIKADKSDFTMSSDYKDCIEYLNKIENKRFVRFFVKNRNKALRILKRIRSIFK